MTELVDIRFPERGMDLSDAFGSQPQATTANGTNVRLYEPSTDRARGGSRPGLVRFVDDRLPKVGPLPGGHE